MVSYIAKGRSSVARTWLLGLSDDEVACVSAVTEAEARYRLAKRPEATALKALMDGFRQHPCSIVGPRRSRSVRVTPSEAGEGRVGLFETQRLTSLAYHLQAEKLQGKASRLRLTSAPLECSWRSSRCLYCHRAHTVCMSPVRSHDEAPIRGEMVCVGGRSHLGSARVCVLLCNHAAPVLSTVRVSGRFG